MDPDVASALFSPSKARQQQAQAKDWDYVTTWLRKKYFPKPIPNFERNEETLQALLNLAAFNERADEEQELIERVEREALSAMQGKVYSSLDQSIYEALSFNLANSQASALDSQARATILLSAPDSAPTTLARRTIDLTTSSFKLSQQLARITTLQTNLVGEHKRLEHLLQAIRSDSNDANNDNSLFSPPADLPQKTSEWTRNTKTMRSKLREYEERLSALNASGMQPNPSIEDVSARQTEMKEMEAKLASLEEELRWYGGMPADVGVAREVLARAKDELRALMEERDRLFEGLVEGGTRKGR